MTEPTRSSGYLFSNLSFVLPHPTTSNALALHFDKDGPKCRDLILKMSEDADVDYYETVEVHGRDFQQYSVDNEVYLVPVDLVSALVCFIIVRIHFARLSAKDDASMHMAATMLMVFRRRNRGSTCSTRYSFTFLARSILNQILNRHGASLTVGMGKARGSLKWRTISPTLRYGFFRQLALCAVR